MADASLILLSAARRATTSPGDWIGGVFFDLSKRLKDNGGKCASAEISFSRFKQAVVNTCPTRQVPRFGVIRESGIEGGDFFIMSR